MPRNHRSAKDAGTKLERDSVRYLQAALGDDNIARRTRTGKDRGDLHGVKFFGNRIVIEIKNVTRMSLPGWVGEAEVERANDDALAGVVLHKRHGNGVAHEQWVSMTLGEFVSLMTLSRDHYEVPP